MTLATVLVVTGCLVGLGVWGALSQQSFVMIMMGLELIINGIILAAAGFWSFRSGGGPEGQVLVIVVMAVMAVEMSIGFALVTALYRRRQVDMTDGIGSLKG